MIGVFILILALAALGWLLLEERQDVFSLKLTYIHDVLTAAAVDGKPLAL